MTAFTLLETPLGPLLACGDETGALTSVALDRAPDPAWRRDDDTLAEVRDELAAYFAGELREFTVTLALRGTPWQRRGWEAVAAIPYGETRTYAQLAAEVGAPAAARAVGHANGRNPICIVVPCHRVVGSDGSLTGYAYGLERKRWLLDRERPA